MAESSQRIKLPLQWDRSANMVVPGVREASARSAHTGHRARRLSLDLLRSSGRSTGPFVGEFVENSTHGTAERVDVAQFGSETGGGLAAVSPCAWNTSVHSSPAVVVYWDVTCTPLGEFWEKVPQK